MDRATLIHLAAALAAHGTPEVFAYALRQTGTRMRAFDLNGARVTIDATGGSSDDAALAEATEVIAALPALVADLAAELEVTRATLAKRNEESPPVPSLRARRWAPAQWIGHRRISGETSTGCDCPVCNVQCEPLFGFGYRCPRCGLKGESCGSTYGFKACELPHGHDGDHESPSGTTWPQSCGQPRRSRAA
jgi:hypothetical protein